jgi:uncharacterized membrane protein YeiH
MKLPEVKAVQCGVCNKVHALSSDTFFRIAGNIYLGAWGGIVGDNLEGDPHYVVRSSVYCKKCFLDIIGAFQEKD